MSRLTASMITPEIIQKFHADMKRKADERQAFFDSDVCKRMIGDIASTAGHLDCDDVYYFAERTQQQFGWGDLTKEQMKMFIEVMSDGEAAEAFIDCPNDDNPFDHSYHLKGGLVVFMMHGQGTVCSIMSAETEPEMYARLLAVKDEV